MGPMRVSEALIDNVARSDRKLIVTLTSGMGSIADNTSGGAFAYRSSKAAVNMMMRSLAIDLAPRGITCVVVNPGWVRTDMGGSHATLTPAESVNRLTLQSRWSRIPLVASVLQSFGPKKRHPSVYSGPKRRSYVRGSMRCGGPT